MLALVREARREHPDRPALVLRAQAATLVALATEHDAYTTMDAAAGAAAVGPLPEPVGRVAVICAGGADTPVAAEAAFVARVTGGEAVPLATTSPGAGSLRCWPTPTGCPTPTAWSWWRGWTPRRWRPWVR